MLNLTLPALADMFDSVLTFAKFCHTALDNGFIALCSGDVCQAINNFTGYKAADYYFGMSGLSQRDSCATCACTVHTSSKVKPTPLV